MVKSALLFLILSIFSASLVYAEVVCSELTCVERGGECGSTNIRTNIFEKSCSSHEDYCSLEYGKNSDIYSSGTCQARIGANQTCKDSNENGCIEGYACVLNSGVSLTYSCQAVSRGLSPGQACTSNADCRYDVDGTTTQNVCNNGICKFTPDGQECSRAYQCNAETSECSTTGMTSVCKAIPKLSLGQACIVYSTSITETVVGCRAPLACIPAVNSTRGTCAYLFSQEVDAGCTADSHCSKGYCVGYSRFPFTTGKCVAYKETATLGEYCLDDDYCSAGNKEECKCQDGDVKCVVADVDIEYSMNYEKVMNCMNDASLVSKCGLRTESNGECYINACKSDYCNYYKDAKKDLESKQTRYIFGQCLNRQICDASTVFASLTFSLLAVVFVLFF